METDRRRWQPIVSRDGSLGTVAWKRAPLVVDWPPARRRRHARHEREQKEDDDEQEEEEEDRKEEDAHWRAGFFLLHHLQRRLVNRRSPKPSFFFLFIFLKKNFSFFLAVTPKNVDFELLRAVVVFVCFRLDANGSRFDSIRFVFFFAGKR